MAYVITEPCVSTCDQACVKACPVDVIHGPSEVAELERGDAKLRGLQLYIDPENCICCAACVPECPVEAIYEEDDLPPKWSHYRALNARFFKD